MLSFPITFSTIIDFVNFLQRQFPPQLLTDFIAVWELTKIVVRFILNESRFFTAQDDFLHRRA